MISIDSSTLILLAKLDLLDIVLETIKTDIVITKKIVEEITAKKTADAFHLQQRINMQKLVIQEAPHKLCTTLINDFRLGEGEAEALSLAIEHNLPLMTDDKRAIKVCKIFTIDFMTTANIVVALCKRKLMTRERALSSLHKLEIYGRYSKELINKAREELP